MTVVHKYSVMGSYLQFGVYHSWIENNKYTGETSKTDARIRNNVLKTQQESTWGKDKETMTAIGCPMTTLPHFAPQLRALS